jgi:hypothetical protein
MNDRIRPCRHDVKRSAVLIRWAGMLLVWLAAIACAGAPTRSPNAAQPLPATAISFSEARQNIGLNREVCGHVAEVRYEPALAGTPTFLHFGAPYPDHAFAVTIWREDRERYPISPEAMFDGEDVCIEGLIELFKGKPQIVARSNTVRLGTIDEP